MSVPLAPPTIDPLAIPEPVTEIDPLEELEPLEDAVELPELPSLEASSSITPTPAPGSARSMPPPSKSHWAAPRATVASDPELNEAHPRAPSEPPAAFAPTVAEPVEMALGEAESPVEAEPMMAAPAEDPEPVVEPPPAVEPKPVVASPAVAERAQDVVPPAVAVKLAPAVEHRPVMERKPAVDPAAVASPPVMVRAPAVVSPAMAANIAATLPFVPQEAELTAARSLVELFEEQLKSKTEKGKPERTARLHYEAARLYESPLGDIQAAARHYEAACKANPDHIPSLRGARRVELRLGSYPSALASLSAEIQLCPDPGQKALLLYQKGCILDGPLAKKREAREAFEQAALLAPSNVTVLKALAHAQEQALAWEPLVQTLERTANALAEFSSQRAAYLTQMARVVWVRLKDVARAIELYKAALAVEPRAPGALLALKELLYRERRWAELVSALELEAALAQDPEAKALAKYRVARVQGERLGDVEASLHALEEAAALAPRDETILGEACRLYEATRRYVELAAALERWAALYERPPVEMLLRLAELYDQQLNQPEAAILRYTAALAIQPGHTPARLALERLRAVRGDFRELAEMLSHQAEVTLDPDERAELYCRVAGLWEEKLSSPETAVAYYRRSLESQPAFAPAYKALVRLLTVARAWSELIEVCERQLDQELPKAERIATLLHIGWIEEAALGRPSTAVNTYRRILEVDAGHLEAIGAVQRAAERGGRFEELVEALEREAKLIQDKAAQESLLHRAAVVLDENLGETDRAIEKLHALLERNAAYVPALSSLAKIYHRDERWEALVGTYQRQLGVLRDAKEKALLLFKMGELAAARLGKPEQAIVHYRAAVQADSQNLHALRALRQALTETGQYRDGVELVEREARLSHDARAAARLWFLAGEFYENRLEQVDKALDAYQKALELVGDYRPALDALARLFEQKNSYAELREHLRKEAESGSDPLFCVQAAYREGEVLRDNLKQLAPAVEAFEAVLQREPRHTGALLALERIGVQLEDKAKLAPLYELEARVFEGAEARVAAYRARVELLNTQDEHAAMVRKEAHRAVLSLLPGDAYSLFELESAALESQDLALLRQVDAQLGAIPLDAQSRAAYQTRLAESLVQTNADTALQLYRLALEKEPENLAAARGVSRIAERLRDPELLAFAAEHEARSLRQPEVGARLLLLAGHQEIAGGRPEAASSLFVRAMEMDPECLEATNALVQLLSGQGQDAFLIDQVARAATAARASEKRTALWLRVAHLHHTLTQDNGAAIAAAKRATGEQPTNPKVHMQLASYYLLGKHWKEAVTTLQEVLKHRPAPELRLSALIHLATVLYERLDRPAQAGPHAQAALEIDGNHRVALALLLRIQLSQGEHKTAADTALRLVRASETPTERAEALAHVGRLESERGNNKQALEAFVEAVSIQGPEGNAGEGFREWLRVRGNAEAWQLYADALSKYLSNAPAGTVKEAAASRKAALLALGRTLAEQLHQAEAGADTLAKALALDPDDLELRAELARRLEKLGRLEQAAKEYATLAQAEPSVSTHWRSLSACYERLLKLEQARLALAPLVVRKEATADEQRRYQDVPAHAGRPAARAIDARMFATLERDAPVSGPALELLAAMAPALPRLYPPPFEQYGVSKNDRVTSRSNNSLRHVADRVAAVFGVEDFELYVHESKRPLIAIELSDEPALFVNVNVSALSEAEQWFAFARAFANVARGLHYADKIEAGELAVLLVAAAKLYAPEFRAPGDPGTLDALGRSIQKAMPWFSGGKLESAARGFAAARLDVAHWVRNVHVTAARAASLLSDDLAAALVLLSRQGFDEAMQQEVLNFAVSDAAVELRRRVISGGG